MYIDFVAFYDQDGSTSHAGVIDPDFADQLVRGLMKALRDRAEDDPWLTFERLQEITAIRVLIQVGKGDFGEAESPEGPDGEQPPAPGSARWGGTPGAWLP